jgi:predicted transposase/invertase (TIGR01784 family)
LTEFRRKRNIMMARDKTKTVAKPGSKGRPLLSLRNDVVFKAVFGDSRNEELLASFLKAALDLPSEEYEHIEFANPFLMKDYFGDKGGIVDIKVHTASKKVLHVELQVIPHEGFVERSIFYSCKMLTGQIKEGEPYTVIHQVISIIITDFELFGDPGYRHDFLLSDGNAGICLTDLLSVHILELPKAGRAVEGGKDEALIDWLRFIGAKGEAEMTELARRNEAIKKAVVKVKRLSADEKMQMIAEAREDALRVEMGRLAFASNQGRAEGIEEGFEKGIEKGLQKGREEGRAEGRAEGFEEGIEKGLQKGTIETKLYIAQSMQGMGMDPAAIAKATGLSAREVGKL